MRAQRIKTLVTGQFPEALIFELEDLSHQHAGRSGTESHFKLKLVSAQFEGLSRVQRQRQLNELLKSEFDQGMHALTMRLLTPEEEAKLNSNFTAPNCKSSKES